MPVQVEMLPGRKETVEGMIKSLEPEQDGEWGRVGGALEQMGLNRGRNKKEIWSLLFLPLFSAICSSAHLQS